MNFHQLAADRQPKAYTLVEIHAGGIKFLEQVECPLPDLVLHAKTAIRDHIPLIRGRKTADSLANQVRCRCHIILQPEVTGFEPRPDQRHFADGAASVSVTAVIGS